MRLRTGFWRSFPLFSRDPSRRRPALLCNGHCRNAVESQLLPANCAVSELSCHHFEPTFSFKRDVRILQAMSCTKASSSPDSPAPLSRQVSPNQDQKTPSAIRNGGVWMKLKSGQHQIPSTVAPFSPHEIYTRQTCFLLLYHTQMIFRAGNVNESGSVFNLKEKKS